MAKPRYVARIESENLRVEFWINSIPVLMLAPGDSVQPVSLPLNEYLVAGANKIEAVLHAAPLASESKDAWPNAAEARQYRGPSSLSMRLALYGPDELVSTSSPPKLAGIDWQGIAATAPQVLPASFAVESTGGPWLWESAVRFASLADAIGSGAQEYLLRLHSMLAAKDHGDFLGESEVKVREMAQAYGMAPGPIRRNMAQVIADHSADPWQFLPLSAGDLDLRLVADGRLVECLRKDRHNAIDYIRPGSKSAFFLPLMIGMAGGKWQILR